MKKSSKKKVAEDEQTTLTSSNVAPSVVLVDPSPLASSTTTTTPSAVAVVSAIPPAVSPTTSSSKYCRVAECRFAASHVTSAHKCGQCGAFGHGVIECDDQAAKDSLIPHTGDRIPAADQCTMIGCRFRHSHMSSAHQCGKCEQYGHSAMACPSHPLVPSSSVSSSSTSFISPLALPSVSAFSGPLYKTGPQKIVKSSANDPSITFLCPICRVSNTVRLAQPNVYNVEVDCVVCNDAKAQVFNPQCGHVCLCWACAKDLK